MNILFLPAWYPDKKNIYAGIFIKESIKAVSLFDETAVIYFDESISGKQKNNKSGPERNEDGIKTLRIPLKKFPFPGMNTIIKIILGIREARRLETEGWKPDIIHAHVYTAGLLALVLGKIYKIPVVISEHLSLIAQRKLRKINSFLMKFIMSRADIVLPVSRYLEDSLRAYQVRNRFKIVPNVVDKGAFVPVPPKNAKMRKKILFIGNLKPVKGLDVLLRSLALVREKRDDFFLDVIGIGPLRKTYEELSAELGINGHISFLGQKTRFELPEIIQNCDFYVQPSFAETFGVSLVEALSCGKPVIASRIPVFIEKLDKRGIVFPAGDVDSLARAVEYMLDHYLEYDPDELSRYVRDNFSYEKVGGQVSAVYRELKESSTYRKRESQKNR